MGRWWKVFVRILRSYTIEEKVVSIIVLGLVFFLSAQLSLDFFSGSLGLAHESGSYTEGLVSERPVILNPLFVDFTEADRELSSLIFSGLSKYDPQKKAFIDDMAVLKISADRKVYTFTLKPNLQWHDGQPVTAEDVYFTFHDLIQNPEFQNPIMRVNFEGIKVKQLDVQTVEFALNNPNSFFLTNMNVGILPKHILKDVAIADLPINSFNVKPVGSGPYKVDSPMEYFDDGRQRVTLKVFDFYHGDRPQLKQIRFTIYPDHEMLSSEKSGLNVVSKVSSTYFQDFQDTKRFSFLYYELPQYTAVFFNLEHPILKKNRVRVSLLKAVDKNELLKILTDKIAVDTPLLELNQAEWIYKANLKEAQGALFDSGYKIDKTDGWRKDSKGNILKFILLARASETGSTMDIEVQKVVSFLKESWKLLGVQLEVQFAPNDEFHKILMARDYDMVLTGQSLGYNLDTYSYWHSSQATKNGLNLSNYKSFAADQLIELIRDTFDSVQKDKKLKDLAKVIADDVPAIFLYHPRYIFATDNKIKGITLQNMAFPSDRYAHIEQWCSGC